MRLLENNFVFFETHRVEVSQLCATALPNLGSNVNLAKLNPFLQLLRHLQEKIFLLVVVEDIVGEGAVAESEKYSCNRSLLAGILLLKRHAVYGGKVDLQEIVVHVVLEVLFDDVLVLIKLRKHLERNDASHVHELDANLERSHVL